MIKFYVFIPEFLSFPLDSVGEMQPILFPFYLLLTNGLPMNATCEKVNATLTSKINSTKMKKTGPE